MKKIIKRFLYWFFFKWSWINAFATYACIIFIRNFNQFDWWQRLMLFNISLIVFGEIYIRYKNAYKKHFNLWKRDKRG